MQSKKQIVAARQSLPDEIAGQFLPLEDSANATAAQAAALMVAMLVGHHDAALPPTAGLEALHHISEAARSAAQTRAHIAQAHVALRELPAKLNLSMSQPECPPDFAGLPPLRMV